MNLSKYYSLLIITPLEKEIKFLKRKINNKYNPTKELDKKHLAILQQILKKYYKNYYYLHK